MKAGRIIALMAVVGLAGVACGQKPAAAPTGASSKSVTAVTWLTDFDAAKKMAAEKQLPILADFSGSDWCGWCIKLDKEVFEKQAFKTYAASNLVLFVADFPRHKAIPEALQKQNEALSKQYNIEGFPSVLLLDATGRVLAKTGYEPGGAEKYVASLQALLKK